MLIQLEISYDTQKKRIGFKYSLPGLFVEKRDFLYIMLERTREEILIQVTGSGEKHENLTEKFEPTFGKGEKTPNVNGL